MSFRVISIGEALVEIMRLTVGQPLGQPGNFTGPFASGAPAIFAVAAARLGASVGFIGGVGDDAFGHLLQARLAAEGVDTTQMQLIPDHTTGVAFVAYAADGSREFVFHLRHAAAGAMDPDKLDSNYFNGVDWLHLSGSTLVLNENSRSICLRALKLTKAAGGRASFDPNLRPELMPVAEARKIFAPFLEAADVILPTATEAHALTNTTNDDAAAQQLLANRDRVVVLKRGSEGCRLYTGTDRLDVTGFAVEEIDSTGAGDCFNAACIVGLQAGWPLAQVARFACAAGALAVTKQGPMEGAPTRTQVEMMSH